MPEGLARAYLLVLAPAAFLAPLPLAWTGGASRPSCSSRSASRSSGGARAGAARARVGRGDERGRAGLPWLGFSAATLRPGLLPTVVHLLLFTGLAKLASLKRPSEARLALLVIFLLTLASASSSTHVSSRAVLRGRGLDRFPHAGAARRAGRLRRGAAGPGAHRGADTRPDGGRRPRRRALHRAALFALPRLHGPFALTPFRVEDALGKALASDRVDLASFGAAKRSDRVILRLSSDRELAPEDSLRLREAVFTDYLDGVWTRDPRVGARRGDRAAHATPVPEARPGGSALISVDLNVLGQGFLFLPYGSRRSRWSRDGPSSFRTA